ncbi:MAG: hypothetical protein OXR72_19515 [Gemmatimonadota bacterium]|nr:hypothetical protein [Gemmatimonadota bacterium]
MVLEHDTIANHPFPNTRPDVKILESSEKIDEIDCPELQWWFAVPRLGEHCLTSAYESDTLALTAVVEIVSTVPAKILDTDCVELRLKEWSARDDWPVEFNPGLMYALLDEQQARWLSVVKTRDGRRVIETEGDKWFEENWGGKMSRRIVDDGRYRRQPDGSYRTTNGKGLGAGTYDVTIAGNTFCCLRVLDPIPGLSTPNGGELVEAFVERGGRTVFFRRYDGQFYRDGDLVRKYPDNRRIVINDTVYVHHDCSGRAHDTITQFALQPARSESGQ